MPRDNDPWTECFIRFKQQVDDHIATLLHDALGIPTTVSRNFNNHWLTPSSARTTDSQASNDSGAANQHHEDTQSASSPARQPHPRDAFFGLSPMRSLFDTGLLTESLYQVMWMSFLVDSPYSPLRLRDLPQPVPRDLPEGADPSLFGFEDAFEDLLSVTSGQGLPDINERYELKKKWNELYPHGLPPILWLHQLCRQGLWDGWEARPDVFGSAISERWRRWLEEQGDPFRADRQGTDQIPTSQTPKQIAGSEEHKPAAREGTASSAPSTEARPGTEEEAYNALAERKGTGSVEEPMWKSLFEQDDGGWKESGQQEKKRTTSRGLPTGWRVDETTREQKDANGNTSVTTTRTTFDDNGREVGRETVTRSHFTWSSNGSGGTQRESRPDSQDDNAGDHKDGTKSWFWK
ncbi:hypothetical protein ACRALDRAFT_1063446 [Sodiomyces alcalophilus JCM 7366]|uniref:uncharacterized protein n=1 Tax=Sodiomyces alcalophilus JCM 7366 TaxID=591952 RepID=UPI0039B5B27C